MVKGIEIFKSHFADWSDCYVLIGGSACDINFSVAALPFRVTRDLDVVLCVEALTPNFFNRFWEFIRNGGYEHREKADGEKQFYLSDSTDTFQFVCQKALKFPFEPEIIDIEKY
mgnify:CR=1 FL=1